jgi:hypothetical protein
MTTGKRAYQAELRERKLEEIRAEIKAAYEGVLAGTFFDYSEKLEKLGKKYGKGLVALAEREFYSEVKKTKELRTNM